MYLRIIHFKKYQIQYYNNYKHKNNFKKYNKIKIRNKKPFLLHFYIILEINAILKELYQKYH